MDHLQGVEAHRLGERTALAHDDGVTLVAAEARGDVRRDVRVALLVPLVLANVVQVIHADDDGALHLRRLDDAGQDATADGDVAGEGALLVDVGAWREGRDWRRNRQIEIGRREASPRALKNREAQP